ncbi:MAG TPA: sodium:proton antiporter [Gemmatimonadales bacterium]|nr:sodium:proton antiporter [Gemmatimonadales bacterium]
MQVFELVIALLLGGAALAAFARRLGLPYPALLALAGAALALVPGTPTVMLDPELALALFVAPVLLDAAFDASPRDLREHWRPVASLALVAVGLTVAAVAVTARALVPEMSWAAAVALGAIVAPPDAAAATAVLRQLRPPHRLLVILEGESLFNDASALLIYRLAVGAAVSGAVVGAQVVPTLLVVSAGSIVLGLVLSRITLVVNTRIRDVATAVIVQFIGTFGVWLLAEAAHLSGILTMVVYAMAVARDAPALIPARIRIPSYAVWEVAVFVLNVLAFILVGLQLKPILARLDRPTAITYLGTAVAVCAVVILVRVIWVLGEEAAGRLRHRGRAVSGRCGSPRNAAIVAWCGMRGIVTLAAALALPTDFPQRELILFTAFCVVLGTLVVQGLTLRPLMRRLGIEQDDAVEREVRLTREETARAAMAALDGAHRENELGHLVLRKYESRLAGSGSQDGQTPTGELMRRAVAAERRRLVELRAEGTIGDDAFHKVEEELDWAELNADAAAAATEGRGA